MSLLMTVLALGCKKGEEATPTQAAGTAGSGTAAATPTAGSATPPPADDSALDGPPIDTCGFVTKDQVGEVIGKVDDDGEAGTPAGTLLGMCTWMNADGMATISARPARDFDDLARDGTAVAGIGEKAVATPNGILIKLAGQPYALQVRVLGNAGIDAAKTEALAKVAATGAR